MKIRTALITTLAALAMTACTTTDPYTGEVRPNYTGRGALIGAAAGAALGYLTNTSDSQEGRTNALIGAGIGVGNVWASYISAIARNPASKEEIGANIWIGFAVTEAIALFALIVALIALFA